MRAVLKQGVFLLLALVAVYPALLGLSHALVPAPNSAVGLDSDSAARTIYMTEPKYVFFNRAALEPDRPRIVFVGASNVVVGFRQHEVQTLLPESEVDNLSVGGSNMTQVAQIIDLVQDLQDKKSRLQTTFVIGMWYGMFTQNRYRWNSPDRHPDDTDIDIERYRYGFYWRTDNGPKEILPSNKLQWGAAFIHPYLALDRLSRDVSKGFRDRFFDHPPIRTDAERNATILAESDKESALQYWREQMHSDGPVNDEQFQVMRGSIDKITAAGSKVLLVDLPIPRWHMQRSPFYAHYLEGRNALLARLKGHTGVAFLDMSDQNEDLEFSDEVHPKPRVTVQWAERVASELRKIDSAPQLALSGSTTVAPADRQ